MHSFPSIKSIGTAVPPHKIMQDRHYSILESANGLSREEKLQLRQVYRNSGIKSRHSVLAEFGEEDRNEHVLFHPAGNNPPVSVSARMDLFEQYATGLCVKAAEKCFSELPGFSLDRITHLVSFSCTGMFAPGIDIQLIEKLGLNRNIERTCINFMGCYAGINALKTAYHICRSEPGAVVLISGVELCTLHYQKNNKQDQLIANAIFADGAAACIISSDPEIKPAEKTEFALRSFYSEYEPSGKDEMVWRIGDFGFDLRLSTLVPDLVKNSISVLLNKLFSKTGIEQNEIDFYAIHPGGIKILEACESSIHITKEQNRFSYEVLNEFGNMSSVTVLFVLEKYFQSLHAGDQGKKILACAFGPGLTMESMILEVQ